jgi:hypothetical protein
MWSVYQYRNPQEGKALPNLIRKETEMFKNRQIQLLGTAVLLTAVAMFVISAVWLPASVQVGTVENDRVVTESNPSGLAQYRLSERGSIVDRQAGLEIYLQSERVQAYPDKVNKAGLDQYYRSERESGAAIQNGLEIYHQSEWHGK